MSEMGSATATVYVPETLKPSRNSSYSAFLNENHFAVLRGSKQDSGGALLRGPRRVIRLCMFGLILPTLLIIIPLYVRLVLYPPGHYPMMPTDQRVLSRHASNVWCKAQYTKMNGSFTTYQTSDTVTLKDGRKRYVMLHNTMLKDDVKEYWGFHLLKGSKVTISTCSSRTGAQLMILRGIENLKRCAWIGEEDSMEEDEGDEVSIFPDIDNSKPIMEIVTSTRAPEIHRGMISDNLHLMQSDEEDATLAQSEQQKPDADEQNMADTADSHKGQQTSDAADLPKRQQTPDAGDLRKGELTSDVAHYDQTENVSDVLMFEDDSDERRQNLQDLLQKAMQMSKSKKEILRILHSVGRGGRKPLPKNIRQMMGITSDEMNASPETPTPLPRRRRLKNGRKPLRKLQARTPQSRLTRSISLDVDENEDGAFERFDDDDDDDRQKKKTIVQHIFYPEGLKFERGKFNQTNYGDKSNEEDQSSYSSSEEALASCEGVILTLPLVSYRSCSYRWTEMNKITYDIPISGTYYFVYSSENEIDTNTIYLNMTFEKVVYDTEGSELVCSNSTSCSVPLSFWSHEEIVVEVPQGDSWNHNYSLDTFCEPRVAVYLTFLLLVPVLILFCAFQ
ncbi:uncharacterized protein [Palaemon carinicauda]|uniref:uncharacterized protein n=1 Tax=Palaemon carinicauda TaxID=392227 RepID=UPI0035B67A36